MDVGPLPSASALVWVDYARSVLAPHGRMPASADVPAEAADSFLASITEWQDLAHRSPEFHWETDVAGDVAEYLVLAFYRVVQRLSGLAEARGAPAAPPEGQPFYVMLVDSLLDALAAEGPAAAEFSDHLRSFWPGLEL